jgi:hypothetical protein
MEETFAVRDRRACRLLEFSRRRFWYAHVVRGERAIIVRLRDLVFCRVRFGYRPLAILLICRGWIVGVRRVRHLYRSEGLMVGTKGRRSGHRIYGCLQQDTPKEPCGRRPKHPPPANY